MKQTGLSLVELLVAISIALIVFAVLASSQVLGFRVTHDSAQIALARDLAGEQMELIRSYGYRNYSSCGSAQARPEDTNSPACTAQNSSTSKHGYTMSWTITNQPAGIPFTNPPALVSVNVTVNYQDKSYVLSTYLSCADGGDYSFTNARCPDESLLD